MSVKAGNNAWGLLATSVATGDTSLTLTTGSTARFPVLVAGDYLWVTLSNAANTLEVIKVTAIVGDVMTVVRGQDGTTASAYASGDRVDLRPTAALFNDKLNVDVAAATYALKNNSVLTGIPVAPTAAPGTNTVQIATTQYVVAQALAASLPAQAGNAGKFITTDGTTASWGQVYPNQTGNAGKFLTTDGTTASWGSPSPYSLPTASNVILGGIKIGSGITIDGSGVVAATVIKSSRIANAILVAADNSTLIDITSGTFTQTFTAAATLGSGWHCIIRNNGTGDITIDPNGAELIDGLTSYVMYPGEARLIQCDGVAFTTIVVQPYRKDFISSGTWIKPPGYRVHGGLAWSGGSSGQNSGAGSTTALGGSGGGCWPFTLDGSVLGATETVTIGAGGAAATSGLVGNIGGATSFGSWFSVVVGNWYTGGAIQSASGAPFTANGSGNAIGFEAPITNTNSYSSIYGGISTPNNAGSNAGASIYGGAAGGSISSSNTIFSAGTSKFGGGGGAAVAAGNGVSGVIPAGGGGATQTGANSGAGARGELRIWGVV